VTARECDSFITRDRMSAPSRSGPEASGSVVPGRSGDLTTGSMDKMTDRMRMTRADRYDRYQSQTTPVHIQVMMPVVVTPEVVAEVEKDKSRRELISRVTGNPSQGLNDPVFFPAERRKVTLSHDTLELEPVDCELLEQMARSVFRRLDLKVTGQPLTCDPRSYFKPNLTVEALLPVGLLMPGEQKEHERELKRAEKEQAKQSQASETPQQ